MNREFLLNYQANERELFKDFFTKVRNGNFGPDDSYPPKNRFKKILDPVATNAYYESIWSQIPLYGSLVICLHPVREDIFAQHFGFNIEDIDNLIDFSKDTGKVQFAIGAPATNFEGLDFLNPIFEELNPPAMVPIPIDSYSSINQVKEDIVEFYTIANIYFKDILNEWGNSQGFSIEQLNKAYEDYCFDYIALKSLGYTEIVEQLEEMLLDDPYEAVDYFNLYATLIVNPKTRAFKAIENFGINELKNHLIKSKEKTFEKHKIPCEVGKFILNKLTYYPESFEACKDVIGRYKQEDLYNLMESLDSGVKSNNLDLIKNNVSEINTVLDNIWNDFTIKNKLFSTKFGISFGLAVVGNMAGGLPGLGGGLLVGLGLNVVDKYVSIKSDSVSEKIVKHFSSNHLCAIFDFKKKYDVK